MSERNVKLFYDEMCKNEKLQNEIKEVLGVVKTESDKQALLNNIAKKYRFDFTPEEAKKFAENLSRSKLSLDDLSEVSGGIGKRTAILAFTALTTLGSLGSAGAIVSHAAPPKNRQTQSSSTDTTKEGNNKKGENDSKNYIVIDDSSDEIDTENANNQKKTTTPDVNGVEKEIIKQENNTTQTTSNTKGENLKRELNDLDDKIQNGKNEKQEKEEEEKRLEEEEKLNKLNSEIINKDNINIFEGLVCSTENLKPLYRMTEDGANREAMRNKLREHSNVVVLVKTDENKIFGGYTSCKIEYNNDNNKAKKDNKAFLFSINLNMKFNIKENKFAIGAEADHGIRFGNYDLVLFTYDNKGYSLFGNEFSNYEDNGITRDEFCGGRKEFNANEFTPIEIEIFERTDVEVTPQEESGLDHNQYLLEHLETLSGILDSTGLNCMIQ